MMAKLRQRFDKLVWSDQLYAYGLPGRILARILRYLVALIRDMFAGGLMMRSMSLVYTTLLSLVPLLAVSFSVLKGFGVHNYLEPVLEEFLAPLGEGSQEISDNIIAFVENINVGCNFGFLRHHLTSMY